MTASIKRSIKAQGRNAVCPSGQALCCIPASSPSAACTSEACYGKASLALKTCWKAVFLRWSHVSKITMTKMAGMQLTKPNWLVAESRRVTAIHWRGKVEKPCVQAVISALVILHSSPERAAAAGLKGGRWSGGCWSFGHKANISYDFWEKHISEISVKCFWEFTACISKQSQSGGTSNTCNANLFCAGFAGGGQQPQPRLRIPVLQTPWSCTGVPRGGSKSVTYINPGRHIMLFFFSH